LKEERVLGTEFCLHVCKEMFDLGNSGKFLYKSYKRLVPFMILLQACTHTHWAYSMIFVNKNNSNVYGKQTVA